MRLNSYCPMGISMLLAACSGSTIDTPDVRESRDAATPGVLDRATASPLAWQYRGDRTHRGVAAFDAELSGPPTMAWAAGPFGVGSYDASKSSPAIDAERVYVGEDDGLLRALDRETGKELWNFATRSHAVELGCSASACTGIHGSPAVDGNHVYIGDYAGWLYALDKATGRLIWEVELGGSIGASPTLYGGQLWIAVEEPTPNGRVFRIDATTGNVEAVSQFLGHHIHGATSLDIQANWLITGNNAGQLYGISAATLEVAWVIPLVGAIKSTAAVDAGQAFVTAWDGALHAVDITSGNQLFSVKTPRLSMSSPALFEGFVCFGSHDAKLRCADRKTGNVKWTAATGNFIQSSPTIVQKSRLVIVGSSDKRLYAFHLDDGALAFQLDLAAKITSVPVVVAHSIFVNDDDGRVVRLDCQ